MSQAWHGAIIRSHLCSQSPGSFWEPKQQIIIIMFTCFTIFFIYQKEKKNLKNRSVSWIDDFDPYCTKNALQLYQYLIFFGNVIIKVRSTLQKFIFMIMYLTVILWAFKQLWLLKKCTYDSMSHPISFTTSISLTAACQSWAKSTVSLSTGGISTLCKIFH